MSRYINRTLKVTSTAQMLPVFSWASKADISRTETREPSCIERHFDTARIGNTYDVTVDVSLNLHHVYLMMQYAS